MFFDSVSPKKCYKCKFKFAFIALFLFFSFLFALWGIIFVARFF